MSPKSIAEKVLGAIEKCIENQAMKKVLSIILALTDKLAQSKVSDIISGISDEKRRNRTGITGYNELYFCKDNQKR